MWDVASAISYLTKTPDDDVKTLTLKVVTLLAILCGQHAQEIFTAMNLRNTNFEENYVKIRIGNVLKKQPKMFMLAWQRSHFFYRIHKFSL